MRVLRFSKSCLLVSIGLNLCFLFYLWLKPTDRIDEQSECSLTDKGLDFLDDETARVQQFVHSLRAHLVFSASTSRENEQKSGASSSGRLLPTPSNTRNRSQAMHELSNERLVQKHLERVFSDGGSVNSKYFNKLCPALVGGDREAVKATLTRPEGRRAHCAPDSSYVNLSCAPFRTSRGFLKVAHPEEIDFPLAFDKIIVLYEYSEHLNHAV